MTDGGSRGAQSVDGDACLKRQAATALGTLRALSLLGTAPTENIVHAIRTVAGAHILVSVDSQPAAAAGRLASVHSVVSLASRQVAEMEAMAREAPRPSTPCPAGLGLKQGLLPVRLAIAWRRHMAALVDALVRARQALEEAAVLCRTASAAVTVCANTTNEGHNSKQAQWTRAASQFLPDARDRLDVAQVSLLEGRAATTPAFDAANLLFDLL